MRKLILDSNRASNGDKNQPKWTLAEPISCDRIRYNSIILPLSWDIVNDSNNKVSFYDNGMGSTPRSFSIPDGTYSPDDLVAALTTGFSAQGTQTYTVSYDHVSGKITISAATSPFKVMYPGTTASKLLGLLGTQQSDPGTTITFSNPIDLTGVKMVLVASTNIRSSTVIVAGADDLNILASIPISQEIETVLCSQNYIDTDYIECDSGLVSTVDIRLLDAETLLPLDLKGKGFTLVLDCHALPA